jgi:hypothetical protein
VPNAKTKSASDCAICFETYLEDFFNNEIERSSR